MPRPHMTGRTPMWTALRRAMHLAQIANQPGTPPPDELVEMRREAVFTRREPGLTRREFLKASLAGAAAVTLERLAGPWLPPADAATPPRIVIVGAGIAGLNTAYQLRKAGVRSVIYEGSARTSGRIFSVHNVMGPGLTTEFGGEFIDSDHKDMFALIREFGLSLIDTDVASERRLVQTFYFDGMHHTERQVVEALRPLMKQIAADANKVPDDIGYQHTGGPAVVALDRMSITEYLEKIGATGWVKEMLEIAWVNEDGLEADQQSSLNMIAETGTDLSKGHWEIYGDSDQRYKVRGGNQQVPDAIARRVRDQIRLGYKLVAIRSRGTGYVLTFTRPGGGSVDVRADFAIITIPFTMLREVDIKVELPPIKSKAIRELAYGTNAKLMLGFQSRLWRAQGYTGEMYSDLPLQCGWDNSQLQPGTHGGYTIFFGGKAGVALKNGTAAERAREYLPNLETIYPGAARHYTGKAARMEWPTYPWVKASYATYSPGQYTSISGAERMTVGRLYFAGEHTSDFQGFMNGGAESGRVAAQALLRRLRKASEVPSLAGLEAAVPVFSGE